MINSRKFFGNPRGVASAVPAFAFAFAAYLINPDNLMLQLAFATLFVLAVVFVVGSFLCSGIGAGEWVKRSFRSRKAGASAIVMLASIIFAGLVPDSWRVAASSICLVATIVVLFMGCALSRQ